MQRLSSFVERILPLTMLGVAVVGVPVMILAPEGLPRLRALEKELADVHGENQEIRRELEQLRREVEQLRDDPAAVERIARDELGLVRQTEVVFQFPRER